MRPISSLVRHPPSAKPTASMPVVSAVGLEQFLRLIGQRFVLYYPSLARVTGSANAALMLGHMLYWSRKFLTKHPERAGWMWCTAAEWTQATGLSRHEQDTARAALKQTGCVEERLMGVPARMHYRVDLDRLGHLVASYLQQRFVGWIWEDAVVRGLLGAPVAYQRVFAEVTGSSAAALYLSDLCQMRKAMNGAPTRADIDGDWMELPISSSAARLARSTKTLRTARNVLLALRLIEERSSRGVKPRIQTRICLQQIMLLVGEKLKNATNSKGENSQLVDLSGMAETRIPEVPKAANWNGGNVQSRSAETGKLEMPKAANKIAGNVTSINRFSTTKGFLSNKQQPQQEPSLPTRSGSCSEKGIRAKVTAAPPAIEQPTQAMTAERLNLRLAFPKSVLPEVATQACRLVAGLPKHQQQEVIDEWIGKLRRANGTVGNQLGYLRGIVRAAEQGTFVPTFAIEIAAARKQASEHAAAMERARSLSPVTAPNPGNGGAPIGTTAVASTKQSRGIPQDCLAAWQKMGVAK